MSANNFLNVKTHVSDLKNNSDKDTVSEVSESGTSNSGASEDLQKLALILGLNSAEEVYQERFRVDRRRLENMLTEGLEETKTAQAFFHRVMTETDTLINWPARLKIGARSKKDPHVRIAGRPEDVKLAREKIMQLLDTRSNRVTMKIDVSYTDHSHIIGKGGLTIKRVMEETGCHIHFPDSNRTSTVEKSNQVSIAGDMERVERARARVRALTPLVFSFELPIVSSAAPLPDLGSPYVQQVQHQYNVQVMLRNRPKLHANLLVVKGVQWEVAAAMEATALLMDYMCGQLARQTQVQMSLEISPMHHSVVVGRGAEQLKVIMKGTNTQIMFPDAADPNIPAIKKSCVTITGQINDVYRARQQLLGSLPLVVIFDVADDLIRMDADFVNQLMQKFNVYVNVRRKPKQGIASVVIKGIERCAGDIYEARRELLGGKEPEIVADIPESYTIPAIPNAMPNFGVFNPFSPTHMTANLNLNSPCSPFNMHLSEMGFNSPMFNPAGPLSPVALTPPVFSNTWVIPSPQPRPGPFHYPTMGMPSPNAMMNMNQGSWNPLSGAVGADMPHTGNVMPPYQTVNHDGRPVSLSQLLSSSCAGSSGYQSNFTGSCGSLDTHNTSGGDGSNVASPSVSPISKSHMGSPVPSEHERSQQELASIISDIPLSERRAVGCEKKTLETLNKMSPLSDYRKLKAEANKAMKEPMNNNYRVPNTRWSGYYFSQTSPSPLKLNSNSETPEKQWNRSTLVRPNIIETSATPPQSQPSPPSQPSQASQGKQCRYQQLYQLLCDSGLHKYTDLFKKHELDMSTFASLSEADLTEIGVMAFGARRKMLLIIAELRKQGNAYKNMNTGAERKLINSPPYNTTVITQQDKW